MKRLVIFILSLVMVLVCLPACVGGNVPGETTAADKTTTSVPTGAVTTASSAVTTKAVETTKAATTAKVTTAAPETTAAPKIEIPVVPEGVMVYFEDFDSYSNTTTNEATMAALGWQIRNTADGALTDNTGKYFIENGTLRFLNYDGGNIAGKDSYTKILTDEYMIACCRGNYTLQYDVKYTDAGDKNRYCVILLNYDGCNSYNSFHLRIAGSANNQIRFIGSWYTYDVAGDFYAADTNDADAGSTVLMKLTGQAYDASVYALKDKWLTIRYQANYNEGPTVYIRDNSQANAQFICVSKPDAAGTGALYWNMIESYAVALKLGTTIDGYLDNVAIWTGLGEMPSDHTTTAYKNAIAGYLAEVSKAN
jgi:hypothetical protein